MSMFNNIPLRSSSRSVIAFGLILFSLGWLLPSYVQAAAGDLDPTFGSGGKVATDFFGNYDNGWAVAIQADGKIVAAGGVNRFSDTPYFGLARYNRDGSLDATFGSGGRVVTAVNAISLILSVALQSDGKIVAAGLTYNGPSIDFALARYNADGSLDTEFGTGGKVTTDFFGEDDRILSLLIQPDGRIVVGGYVGKRDNFFRSLSTYAIVRYNSDGNLDVGFGSGGKVLGDFNKPDAFGDIGIQADGKIVMTGGTLLSTGESGYAVRRYNTDGTIDTTFGSDGMAVSPNILGTTALVIQGDGRVVVGGTSVNITGFYLEFTLERYNTNGSLDTTFGNGGKATTDFGGSTQMHDLAVQGNGKLVAVGEISVNQFTSLDMCLSRYNTDGSPDLGFGSGGKLTTDFFGSFDVANAVAIQNDGRIVVVGYTRSSLFEDNDFAVARYEGDGPTFDICFQDDSNGNLLQLNSTTGDYQFTNCSGFTLTGTGTLTTRGSTITLQHNSTDRRLVARIDNSSKRATASIQVLSAGLTFSITDRNLANNSCACR